MDKVEQLPVDKFVSGWSGRGKCRGRMVHSTHTCRPVITKCYIPKVIREQSAHTNYTMPRTHQNDPYGVIVSRPCIALGIRLNPSQGDILRSTRFDRYQ